MMISENRKPAVKFLILISILCGILNFFNTIFFEGVLHLPLFMDTIFVMTVLFGLGLLPALGTF